MLIILIAFIFISCGAEHLEEYKDYGGISDLIIGIAALVFAFLLIFI